MYICRVIHASRIKLCCFLVALMAIPAHALSDKERYSLYTSKLELEQYGSELFTIPGPLFGRSHKKYFDFKFSKSSKKSKEGWRMRGLNFYYYHKDKGLWKLKLRGNKIGIRYTVKF